MGYKLKKTMKVSELALRLKMPTIGDDKEIVGVSSLAESTPDMLTFSKACLDPSKGYLAIVSSECKSPRLPTQSTFLFSNNPRLDYIRALELLEKLIGFSTFEFNSIIHPSVIIGKNVVIEDGCLIQEGVTLEHNVVIHKGTRIGRNSRIRANSSIGGDGFGFERLSNGTPIRFVHLGGVSIGENVEIGSNSCIVRGTLGDTVISDNVKVDNLVHIAHNCHIENGAFIIACAEISGGVRVGKNSWIGPNASIIQKVTIGENALIGLGAVVTKNVDENIVFAGNPAKKIRDLQTPP